MENKPQSAKEIIFSLPGRFKKEEFDNVEDLTFHFELTGDNGGHYSVILVDGEVTVTEGHNGEAECMVKTTTTIYEDIEHGRTNAQMAFMMGRIKISNIGAMLKFIDMFHRLH